MSNSEFKYLNQMKLLTALMVSCFIFSTVNAQDQRTQIQYKKGEVLDIILASLQPDTDEKYNRYRKTAFPIAMEYSFELMPVFGIRELILGTNFPSTFIFGKWNSIENREAFLENITTRLPDFHDQRRHLFNQFGLTYYEVEEDLNFFIDEGKHTVATAFWKGEMKGYSTFLKDWKKKVEESGGKIIVELTNGTSPTGYYYNPDSFILVEWNTQEAFEGFSKENPLSVYEVLQNVHQFRIE